MTLPPAGEAHVWEVNLCCDKATTAACAAVLSPQELARGERFRSGEDAARFVAAHGHLRSILGAYAGVHASRITFSFSPHGKPSLDDAGRSPGLRFNMADSGDTALVAVTREREVGVDIERVDERVDLDAVSARCFSPAEQRCMMEAPGEDRVGLFFTLWARKEAYIKGRGEGMLLDLRSIDVSRAPATIDGRWRIDDIAARAGYRSAFSVDGGNGRFTMYAPEQSAGALFNQEQ